MSELLNQPVEEFFDDDFDSEVVTSVDEDDESDQLSDNETLDRRYDKGVSSDLVRVYMDQIGKTDLLNAEQEVELSKDIEAGLYAQHLLGRAALGEITLSAAKRRDYEEIASIGKDAKDHMLKANLRLTVSLAKRYTGRGLDMLDVIQEGNLGLNRAVEKFDYKKGFKFSTYATWWIKQSITRGIGDTSRTIRLPVHIAEKVQKLDRVKREISQEYGREATIEELVSEMEMEPEKLKDLIGYSQEAMSLDAVVRKDETGDMTFADLIEDKVTSRIDDDVVEDTMNKDMLAVMREVLTEREFLVVTMRSGVHTGEPMTLDSIAPYIGRENSWHPASGEDKGITREAVRLIDVKARKKLAKNPIIQQYFKDLTGR